jgi:hypothetical protein
LRRIIGNNKFDLLHSFSSVVDPELYYVMNFKGKNIIVFDENWGSQRIITPPSTEYPIFGPAFSMNINGLIYASSDDIINKYDKNFNLIKQINSSGHNRGIYYNPSNQMIYITICNQNIINLFDKDLNLKSTLNTNYSPFFITKYNNQMVVSDQNNGNIYFYQNNAIIQTVSSQCNRVSTVLFDNYNNMLALCHDSSIMYVYHVKGSYSGLSMSICRNISNSWFVNFDLKDRLVIICNNQIEIFY